jgi:hypothetical protein
MVDMRAAAKWTILALMSGALVLSCTDARLQADPPDPPQKFDNLLDVKGEICTLPADELTFPVKILFILDQSASLQCTDSQYRRFDALNQVISDLDPLPNVSFAFIGFSSWSIRTGGGGSAFTKDRDQFDTFLNPATGLGPATDYQGALATAVQVIEQDMVAAGAAVRARTKYVIVFMSDGIAEPRCNAGCEDTRSNCSNGRDDDGDGNLDGADPDCQNINDNTLHPDNLYGVCNTDLEIPDGVYVDMQGVCPAYNQPEQIFQRIEDILALKDAYSAGDINLHTVLLFSPDEVVAGICGDVSAFGYDHDQARAQLQAMAAVGNGVFRDVNLEYQDDNFLEFDFTALDSEYWLTEVVATNLHARITAQGPIPDSDTDGLSDEAEAELDTDHMMWDTDVDVDLGFPDGDYYSDLFETRYAQSGFDPLNPLLPSVRCPDPTDLDGDFLIDCEEEFMGTDIRAPDTDRDGILDWLELVVGTNPLVDDAEEDLDFDGNSNRAEIRAGTDPLTPDNDRYRKERVRYGLEEAGEKMIYNPDIGEEERRSCYNFEANDIQLVVTPLVREQGLNRILIYALERPLDLVNTQGIAHVACTEVYYKGETVKDPPSGEVDLTQEYWDGVRSKIGSQVEAISACRGYTEPGQLTRGEVEAVIDQCLPGKVQIGDILYKKDELLDTGRRYLNGGMEPRLPAVAAELFVPLELFDPELHCHRAWELGRLDALLEKVVGVCDCELGG